MKHRLYNFLVALCVLMIAFPAYSPAKKKGKALDASFVKAFEDLQQEIEINKGRIEYILGLMIDLSYVVKKEGEAGYLYPNEEGMSFPLNLLYFNNLLIDNWKEISKMNAANSYATQVTRKESEGNVKYSFSLGHITKYLNEYYVERYGKDCYVFEVKVEGEGSSTFWAIFKKIDPKYGAHSWYIIDIFAYYVG